MEPTNNDPMTRTMNRDAVAGGVNDSYRCVMNRAWAQFSAVMPCATQPMAETHTGLVINTSAGPRSQSACTLRFLFALCVCFADTTRGARQVSYAFFSPAHKTKSLCIAPGQSTSPLYPRTISWSALKHTRSTKSYSKRAPPPLIFGRG